MKWSLRSLDTGEKPNSTEWFAYPTDALAEVTTILQEEVQNIPVLQNVSAWSLRTPWNPLEAFPVRNCQTNTCTAGLDLLLLNNATCQKGGLLKNNTTKPKTKMIKRRQYSILTHTDASFVGGCQYRI